MKLTGHIITDSRNHGSQYISTTFSFNNAVKYATTGYKKIGRIAVIDMSKVSPDCIHNCSSYEAAYSELGCCTRAVRYAVASKEVLIEQKIPAEAIIKILTVDKDGNIIGEECPN